MDETLQNLMPPYVLNKLKNDEKSIADDLKDVTLLFTDMVNFTKFSN